MLPIDLQLGARGALTPARPIDIAQRPRTGQGRISPSSMANRASNHSHQNPNAMAAWNALLVSSPSLNPGLRAEPERRNISRQHAQALVDEFRTDLYNKTALLSRARVGLPKASGKRIADGYIGMLTQAGYFTDRVELLLQSATEGWLQKSRQMLRQHNIEHPVEPFFTDARQYGSKAAQRRYRMSVIVPRKRDVLFKLELFTICPDESSGLDIRIGHRPVEKENIALFRNLLSAWRLGPADFGLAQDPARFEAALVAAARQTPRPYLANLLKRSTAPDVQRCADEEVLLRPTLDQQFHTLVAQPAFARRYQRLVAQEKARYPNYPTPTEVRAERNLRRAAHTERLLQDAMAEQKRTLLVEPAVAQSGPDSV